MTMTLQLRLLKKGQGTDIDFDNEFIPAEKSDEMYSIRRNAAISRA